jgi:predicted nuclease of predicted toxin-antitoxin system
MRLIIDMNLSPSWCEVLRAAGVEAIHWSDVGDPGAADEEVLGWARRNNAILFTHDLDFGRILALTGADGPSVVQVREQDVSPATIGRAVTLALEECSEILLKGAVVTIDLRRAKARFLPLR